MNFLETFKEKTDKEQYDSALDSLINENVMIMKWLQMEYGLEAVDKYCRKDIEWSVERRIGPVKNALISLINKLAPRKLLETFIKEIIDGGQFLIPLKCYKSIEINDNGAIAINEKCQAKRKFNKAVKKLKCTEDPWAKDGLGYCNYWCAPLFKKLLSYINQPVDVEFQDKGCILKIELKNKS
ncbi:MAG: hypothetical protein ACTSRG_19120 [Candidatus Helarchaeota archaeon]